MSSEKLSARPSVVVSPADAQAASADAASGRWPPAECARSLRLRANFRSLAAPILPALIERRANLGARRFDSPRSRGISSGR